MHYTHIRRSCAPGGAHPRAPIGLALDCNKYFFLNNFNE